MGLFAKFFPRKAASDSSPLANSLPVVRGYQIVYDDITRGQRDPGFEALENSGSGRQDWYEYWPIRNYLRTMSLDESTLYGFVSPQFYAKTHLSAADVRRFIESSADADVFTFSPFPCHGASFLNVFEQGNFFDPGFLQIATEFFERIENKTKLRELVNHSGNVVYCNYLFAKPRFWREWVRICDQLFDATEGEESCKSLNEQIQYCKENGESSVVDRKVFIMERVAPYLLASSNRFSTINFPIQQMPVSQTHINLRSQISVLDDLKRRYLETGRSEMLEQYRLEQRNVMAVAWPGYELPNS